MTSAPRRSAVPRAARFERPRTHLLARLTDSLDAPLIVLAAASGYGKTTLLAQYARVTPRRVAWCRLTDGQEGPGQITARLAQSAGLAALTELDPRTPPGALLELLTSALSTLNDGVDLIVDNVESDAQREWLARLSDALEEGHRLLISTYSTDGLRIARRIADGQAVVLDTADLAFTVQETEAYLQERGAPAPAEDLRHLGGWPAGLALAAHGAPRHARADDLVLEALGTLPPELRAALPLLSPLDLWTDADAAVLAPELPSGWLQAVQRAGLPVTALGGGTFQPHRLLVSVLTTQLARQPERAAAVKLAAAGLAETRGDAERAAALYLQAAQPTLALRVAEPLVQLYRDRGEHHRTRALLEAFSQETLSPALQERLAWAQVETGAAAQGEAALEALRRAGTLSASGLASLAMIRGRRGDTDGQYALSREGLALDGPTVPALYWPFVQAALRLGHHAEAEGAAERLRRWAQRGTDAVRQAEAWHLQAITWQRTRSPDEAARPLARARAAYEALGWQGRAAGLHLDELELAVRAGEASDVLAVTLGALDTRLPPDAAVLQLRRLRLLGTVQRRLGQLGAAEQILRQALAVAREASIHPGGAGLTVALADVLLAQGQTDEARDWLQEEAPGQSGVLLALLRAQASGAPLRLREADLTDEPDAETRQRARAALGLEAGVPVGPAPAAGSAYTLQLITLGDCCAAINGRPVRVGLAKARELLAWLALHGSGSRDELVTALWDGSAEERHVEYFRVTVRRLRAALRAHLPDGLDPLPYADGRYRLDRSLTVEVDVHGPVTPGALKPFLPGTDTEWAARYRQAQAERAASVLLAGAAALPAAQAAEAYRTLLRVEPLLAGAHEGLILALHALGDPGPLELAVQSYERTLREEYGEPLPAAIRALRAAPAGS
ncbi:tetratricopeptide repeat protein (plasmid) [Deinococcus taeanensis]|uniref:tetratricopeptide repeat protein n=1 Tax=Deinococcus taeanensis TaxID=2737050 RepID=UPI001CDBED83|nr:tetratricopeptide repeat protein [Deinococcus taeanensis]UBV44353.1 tetratricopeptide repeat protein [Deinococcus taeanensis]